MTASVQRARYLDVHVSIDAPLGRYPVVPRRSARLLLEPQREIVRVHSDFGRRWRAWLSAVQGASRRSPSRELATAPLQSLPSFGSPLISRYSRRQYDLPYGANRKLARAMVWDYDHSPGPMIPPLSMADQNKPEAAKNPLDILGRKRRTCPMSHQTATLSKRAPAPMSRGDSSRYSSMASLMFAFASASLAPAETQPGNSGHQTANSPVSGSLSSTMRQVMTPFYARRKCPTTPARTRKVYRCRCLSTPPSPRR